MVCLQIIVGPAGSGKSTYCQAIQEHAATMGRSVHVANLDPAAEHFAYEPSLDVRELISVEEVMEELGLGPNGGLIYCMEYLLNNLEWLQEHLDSFGGEDYLLLDCPGQIELYTHVPIMKQITESIKLWGYQKVASVFVLDAAFLIDASKFLSGSLLSLSAMVALELPHINVLSKCDLIDEEQVERILSRTSAIQLWEDDQIQSSLIASDDDGEYVRRLEQRRKKRHRLTESICQLLDDYSMVSYVPLNIKDEDSLQHCLDTMDHAVQYGEDLEVRAEDFELHPGANSGD